MFEQTIMKLRQHRALRRLRYGLILHAEKTLGKVKASWTKERLSALAVRKSQVPSW